MDLDLRQSIVMNIKDKTEEQLKDMVETAIEDNEEVTLPGLGVIFEIIWRHTDGKTKESMIETLHSNL